MHEDLIISVRRKFVYVPNFERSVQLYHFPVPQRLDAISYELRPIFLKLTICIRI